MSILHSIQMEIDQFMQSYWQTYFSGDLQKYSSLIREDYHNIGTTETEDWRSKTEMMRYSESVIDQMVGTVQVRNRKLHIMPIYPYYMVHEHIDLYIHTDNQWVFYSKMRLSSLIEKNNFGWQVIHQHGSVPDAKVAENESIGFEQVQRENRELRDAIKRSTYELEQKNKELEIEASLERVRTVAMGMNKPDDMLDVCRIISTQLRGLGIEELRNVQTAIFNPQQESYMNYEYFSGPDKTVVTEVAYKEQLDVQEFATRMMSDPDAFFTTSFTKEQLKSFIDYQKRAGQFIDPKQFEANELHYYFYSIGPGALGVSSYIPYNDDQLTIIKRFRNVFELAYKRYADIELAEAQAREAIIEAAVEKVRSRSLAMYNSHELNDVVKVLFEKLTELDVRSTAIGIQTFSENSKDVQCYVCGDVGTGLVINQYILPYFDHPIINDFQNAYKNKQDFSVGRYSKIEKDSFYDVVLELPELKDIQDEVKTMVRDSDFYEITMVPAEKSLLVVNDFHGDPLSESQINILKRFAKVFDQTYTRFLDLQKAETQAREAQIEASLERVRSRSMAMHKSEELLGVITVVSEQLQHLNFKFDTVSFAINNQEHDYTFWFAIKGNLTPMYIQVPYIKNPMFDRLKDILNEGTNFYADTLTPEESKKWHQHVFTYADIPSMNEEVKAYIFRSGYARSIAINPSIMLIVSNYAGQPYSNNQNEVIQRFAKVFEQTYIRFLDLQKAEAQAREAQIEAALEKVRSRSLAMQKSDELTDVAELLRKEMGQLGIEELETSSIYIVDKENQQAACWYAIKDIREKNKRLVSDEITITFDDTWVGTEMKKFYRAKKQQASIIMKGENRKEWINYCAGKSQVLQGYYGDNIPERTYHLVKFAGGYVGAAASGDISAESWDLLRRATSVFSLAYTRFNDLQIAETNALKAERDLIAIKEAKQKAEETLKELQATQRQLIQSEKMASLGELTAGIAHEIQNPLNFVNNFSEVSNELIDEMKEELSRGDIEEAIAISTDIKSNLEKIHFHGKRADAIVKGMLQHSRTSSGQKELTDINALCDEYLRLAYHGLRAKDKTFNTEMETHFDPDLPKISIVPQDIGRVILNIINNAFYAVSEKSKVLSQKSGSDYLPKVTVSTKSMDDKIEISISDNGNGIPDHIKDKIFQPFFTTKPTGQGTGLGLSLSYDIVKAHGGELTLESIEGKGTVFRIQIPIS
jgi:signal transduction histidine kinase